MRNRKTNLFPYKLCRLKFQSPSFLGHVNMKALGTNSVPVMVKKEKVIIINKQTNKPM